MGLQASYNAACLLFETSFKMPSEANIRRIIQLVNRPVPCCLVIWRGRHLGSLPFGRGKLQYAARAQVEALAGYQQVHAQVLPANGLAAPHAP